jgi:hypothetical protein
LPLIQPADQRDKKQPQRNNVDHGGRVYLTDRNSISRGRWVELWDITGSGRYDVTQDGQRFIVDAIVDMDVAPSFTVVLNWATGLKR